MRSEPLKPINNHILGICGDLLSFVTILVQWLPHSTNYHQFVNRASNQSKYSVRNYWSAHFFFPLFSPFSIHVNKCCFLLSPLPLLVCRTLLSALVCLLSSLPESKIGPACLCVLVCPSISAKDVSMIRNRWVSTSSACVPSDLLLSYLA